jgi:phosphotransferase system IIA component
MQRRVEMDVWTMDPFDGSDKEIRIYAGDVLIEVDYDDVDHEEAETLARFILAMQDKYEEWKAANKE